MFESGMSWVYESGWSPECSDQACPRVFESVGCSNQALNQVFESCGIRLFESCEVRVFESRWCSAQARQAVLTYDELDMFRVESPRHDVA